MCIRDRYARAQHDLTAGAEELRRARIVGGIAVAQLQKAAAAVGAHADRAAPRRVDVPALSLIHIFHTGEGGMHELGFKNSLTKVINDYARKRNYLKADDKNLAGEDVREGLSAVTVSYTHLDVYKRQQMTFSVHLLLNFLLQKKSR